MLLRETLLLAIAFIPDAALAQTTPTPPAEPAPEAEQQQPPPTQPAAPVTPPSPTLAPPADLPPLGSANEPRAIAGYDHGLYIATRDDAFHLGISAWLQARWELDRSDGDLQERFSVPVGRVLLSGHAFGTTELMLAGDAGQGLFQLVDAYVDQPLGPLRFRIGQSRPFFSQQQLTEVVHLELTDRPLTFAFAGISRDLGVSLYHEPAISSGGVELAIGIFDGTGITPSVRCPVITDPVTMETVATCFPPSTVPADVRPLGVVRIGWSSSRADPYHEGDLDGDRPRVAFGIGYAIDIANGKPRAMAHDLTADVVFKAYGWSVTTAAFLKNVREMTGRTTDFAWHAQLGYVFVPRLLEIAGRFAQVPVASGYEREVLGVFDVYRRGHALKWQLEGGGVQTTGATSLAWVGRIQTQLLF